MLALVATAALGLPAGLRSDTTTAYPRGVVSRRAALAGAGAALSSSVLARQPVAAETQLEVGGALGATCLGFGCNPYGRPDFNGLEESPEGSIPYPEFLEKLKKKEVEGVVFMPPSGDVAYALIGGKSIRIGKGWPIEVSNGWSSPSWVVRILENEGVPYKFNYDLSPKTKVFPKPNERQAVAKYDPKAPS